MKSSMMKPAWMIQRHPRFKGVAVAGGLEGVFVSVIHPCKGEWCFVEVVANL